LIPNNRTELRWFLGLKTQIQAWIPELNYKCKELHQLTSENTAWVWMEIHQKESEETKKALASMITLTSYTFFYKNTLYKNAEP
jgi:phage anti-repressor protein